MPRYCDADAFAQMQDEDHARRLAANARQLSGADIAKLRRALDAAHTALSRINDRGLPFAHRKDFIAARAAIQDAYPLVARQMPAGAEGAD